MEYNDDYSTCAETYSTLRIYGVPPDTVTEVLGLDPSNTQAATTGPDRGHPHGWFLSSKEQLSSRDVRRHLDWLLDCLLPKAEALHRIRGMGASVDISNYWLSASGHGGPTISPQQSEKLATLDLECWFDVYCVGDETEDAG